MDYRKLNPSSENDNFLILFKDQMRDKLSERMWYCFSDGNAWYNQIYIALKEKDKTTFNFPYGTFVFKRMSFGLRNSPTSFQRCMLSIIEDMVEDNM